MFGIALHIRDGHLMRAKCPLDLYAVHHARTSPALGGTQHDHRPARALSKTMDTRLLLIRANVCVAGVQRFGEEAVHGHRIVALDKMSLIALSTEQRGKVL